MDAVGDSNPNPSTPSAPISPSDRDGEDLFAELRASFLRATGADRCTIELDPQWQQTVGQWLGDGRPDPPLGNESQTPPASRITVRYAAGARPFDTGMSAAKLILSGVLDRYPNLKLRLTHMDGGNEVAVELLFGGVHAARIAITTSDNRRLEAVLRGLNAFIPKVSSRLCLGWLREQTNVYERRRLAQDLHDGPLQLATAAKIRMQARRQASERAEAAESLDEAINLTGQVIDAMRELIDGRVKNLGPSSVQHQLRRAALRWAEVTGVRVLFGFGAAVGEDLDTISPETLEVAEHVVGESIMNAWRHGKASQLSLSCDHRDGGLLLTLTDDGRGYQPSETPPLARGSRMGLRLLRLRVSELGGWFDIRSPRGGGTIVETWLPPRQAMSQVAE
jgi:signal transduction histidine kinase